MLKLTTFAVASARLPRAFDGYRIAHVSDVHSARSARKGGRLLALLKKMKPDIIAITGDLLYSRRVRTEIPLAFAAEAVKIAPCYFVGGNHEARVPEYEDFRTALSKVGVRVLADEMLPLVRKGESIRLFGASDPRFDTRNVKHEGVPMMQRKLQGLKEGEDLYTVLLSHRPELFPVYAKSGADLVLCGHAHGGQFRLPLVGGLYAPGQGLFPRYDAGRFTDGRTTMIVSRGIGRSLIPLRLCNPPEVLLIELTAER